MGIIFKQSIYTFISTHFQVQDFFFIQDHSVVIVDKLHKTHQQKL